MAHYSNHTKAVEKGQISQNLFESLISKKGYKFKKATKEQQKLHIDYTILKEGKQYTFDVKSDKRVNRYGEQVKFITIEVDSKWALLDRQQSKPKGKTSWLFAKIDYIAFQIGLQFYMVKPKDLQDLINLKVNQKEQVYSSKDCLYKIYKRKCQDNIKDSKGDIIFDTLTMVKVQDIKNISCGLIK